MRNFIYLAILGTSLIMASCNKNQKAVKMLDGTWEITKIDGSSFDPGSSITLNFSKCKLKKDDYCDVVYTEIEPGYPNYTEAFRYKVIDDGKKMEFKFSEGGISFSYTMQILELTKSNLALLINFDGDYERWDLVKK